MVDILDVGLHFERDAFYLFSLTLQHLSGLIYGHGRRHTKHCSLFGEVVGHEVEDLGFNLVLVQLEISARIGEGVFCFNIIAGDIVLCENNPIELHVFKDSFKLLPGRFVQVGKILRNLYV